MTRSLLVALLLAAVSGPAAAGWSAAGGVDTGRDTGYGELRYDTERWGAWVGANNSSPHVGAELHKTWGPFLFGVGAVLARPDEIVGSSLRYELRAEWQVTERLSLGWIHESNCRSICEKGLLSVLPHATGRTANAGYNFLVLRVSW